MPSLRRLAIAALGSAMLASVVSAPADAQWRRGGYYGGLHGGWGYGGPRYYGGWRGGYGWHGYYRSAPVWPYVAGGLIGLGALGALAAPYYAPPPVYYAPPPAYYPPGYYAVPPGYYAPRPW